jgi:ribonucleoside-diphosphate reductase alpha chain
MFRFSFVSVSKMNAIFPPLKGQLPAISQQIWEMKYRLGASEPTLETSFHRVASAVAAAEKPELRETYERQFFELMADLRFLPAGRILAGAGTGRAVTLFNCFVMDKITDSITGIFNGLNEAAQTLQQGGGIGHDFSTLRPKDAFVHGVGADASGPLSFMDVWDSMCRTIMSAGARRGAMMGTLRCDHPDIEAFIEAKRDKTKLRNFNLSVLVTDAFMAAIKSDADWPLVFDGEVFKIIPARSLWQKIMKATYDCAEPGVIFIDRINAKNPLAYCETISCTNPCGEQPLPAYGACLLGSLNLTRFVNVPFEDDASINFKALHNATLLAIRFLDNVIDVSNYPLPQQKAEALNKRRLGLGVTGLADALLMCGLRYGSPDSTKLAALCMKTIRDAALVSSTALAKEKGSFPLFNADDYLTTEYAQSLSADQRTMIKANGLRNGLLTSIAPTGTISLLAGNVSSGIEPIFNAGYERNITNPNGSHRTELLEDYAVALWRSQSEGLPPAFVTVDDLKPVDHLNMAAAVQPFVDSSISKTVNLPEMIDFQNFTSVYEEAYALGLKGCTTFRPNEITGSILKSTPQKELCPSCGSDKLVAKEGCKSCTNCGFALCG